MLTYKSEIPPELNTLANLQEWRLVPFSFTQYIFFPSSTKCHLCTCVSDGKCIGISKITLNFIFPFRFLLGWIFKKRKNLIKSRDYQLTSETSFFWNRSSSSCDLEQSWYLNPWKRSHSAFSIKKQQHPIYSMIWIVSWKI